MTNFNAIMHQITALQRTDPLAGVHGPTSKGRSKSISKPNFVQIGAPVAEIWRHIHFVNMAAATAKYYFRFRILLMSLPSDGQSLSAYQLSSNISIFGWDITTSGFEIQTSAILEFYFRFRSRPFRRNRHVILHPAAEIYPNRNIHCRNMMSCRF